MPLPKIIAYIPVKAAMNTIRLLLLEDSAIDADLIQAVLTEGGLDYKLIQVQTRAEFLAALEQHTFDLILADYSLPTFDGISALEIASVQCPDIPFIFVSGTLGEEVAVEMLKSGATDYVVKQRLERLVPSIHRALQESRERMARQQAEAQLHRYTNRLTMLAETSRTFSEAILNFQTLLDTVCCSIGQLLGDACILQLISDDEQWLQTRAVYHPNPETIAQLQHHSTASPQRVTEGLSAQVIQTQQPLLLPIAAIEQLTPTPQADPLLYLEKFNLTTLLIVPLQVRGRCIGTLSLLREMPHLHTLEDELFLQDLADRAALAIDNGRLYQKSQEANRIKDEFLAMLSHELRSPLNAIIGWLTLLRSRKFDEVTTTRALETVERNARSQARLIEDLLDVSRILQGKLRLSLRPLDLLPVIKAAIDTIRPTAEVKNIHLQTELNAAVGQISGDAERLQQVVWNLLTNAVKFTPQGGTINIRLEQVEEQVSFQESVSTHYYAQITVTDTGQGIKPEFIPYVFERFRQADSSITRKHGGLGLGLAIVRHLVELHGGTIQAYSPGEGLGATFTVKLPLLVNNLESGHPSHPEVDASPNLPSTRLDTVRILIVDDDLDARSLLTTIFNNCGADTVAVASANEGLTTLSNVMNRFDILISDIGMPGEDGYTLLRQVRALAPEQGGQIPAIAVTAYAREDDRKAALSAGFQAHVAKPIDPAKLIEIVTSLTTQQVACITPLAKDNT